MGQLRIHAILKQTLKKLVLVGIITVDLPTSSECMGENIGMIVAQRTLKADLNSLSRCSIYTTSLHFPAQSIPARHMFLYTFSYSLTQAHAPAEALAFPARYPAAFQPRSYPSSRGLPKPSSLNLKCQQARRASDYLAMYVMWAQGGGCLWICTVLQETEAGTAHVWHISSQLAKAPSTHVSGR